MTHGTDRRAIPQREARWAGRIADALFAVRIRPNHISIASLVLALIGAAALALSGTQVPLPRAGLLLIAAGCTPLRLLFNMLDGMLAVEKGLQSPTGDLFNEVPDRLADLALIAGAGYAIAGTWVSGSLDWGVGLGWLGGAAAVLTAYVRTLGAAQGVGNFFDGPAPKQVRMWALVTACLTSLVEPESWRGVSLLIALGLIAAGSLVTVVVRLRQISRAVHAAAAGRG